LEELRGGNRSANIEPVLDRVGEELVHAPDGDGFLSGLSLILCRLEVAYREHLDAADASANAMEIRILRRLVEDVAQLSEALATATQTAVLPRNGDGARQLIGAIHQSILELT